MNPLPNFLRRQSRDAAAEARKEAALAKAEARFDSLVSKLAKDGDLSEAEDADLERLQNELGITVNAVMGRVETIQRQRNPQRAYLLPSLTDLNGEFQRRQRGIECNLFGIDREREMKKFNAEKIEVLGLADYVVHRDGSASYENWRPGRLTKLVEAARASNIPCIELSKAFLASVVGRYFGLREGEPSDLFPYYDFVPAPGQTAAEFQSLLFQYRRAVEECDRKRRELATNSRPFGN